MRSVDVARIKSHLRGERLTNEQYNDILDTLNICRGPDSPKHEIIQQNQLVVSNTPGLRVVGMEASEALIRAREAVIAAGYVPGLDAEQQIRAGMHDDWAVLQIAYHALQTSSVDLDVLRKYHAPGQLSVIKKNENPVVVNVTRERRSVFNILCVKIARWFDVKCGETRAAHRRQLREQFLPASVPLTSTAPWEKTGQGHFIKVMKKAERSISDAKARVERTRKMVKLNTSAKQTNWMY